jgi:hypothetical protein
MSKPLLLRAGQAASCIVHVVHKAIELAREPIDLLHVSHMLSRGGGVIAGLVVVAVGGWYLPGVVRLIVLVLGALAVTRYWSLEGDLGFALRPFAVGVVIWLAMAWGWGLLNPWLGLVLLGLMLLGTWRWIVYYALKIPDEETPQPEQAPRRPPPPEMVTPIALEKLDEMLRDAPPEGWPRSRYVDEMAGLMSPRTVAKYLALRGIQPRHGHYRAGPTLLIEPPAGGEEEEAC